MDRLRLAHGRARPPRCAGLSPAGDRSATAKPRASMRAIARVFDARGSVAKSVKIVPRGIRKPAAVEASANSSAHRGGLCMIVHAYYPIGEPRVQREAKAARDVGYKVTVICLRQAGEPRHEQVDGIDVRRVGLHHVRGAGLGRMIFEYLAFTFLATILLSPAAAHRTYDV